MPNLQNAKKALRVANRRRAVNDNRRRVMKETIRATKTVAGSDKKTDAVNLSKSYKAIDKALKLGVIKKNTANRKKSRLAKTLKSVAK